jgi:DNA-binding GntR family transcriptional regulator
LPPGRKLKIVELRNRYDVGASPLREALSRLSGERLITAEGRRGFSVADMSIEDAKDVGRVRLHLELECLRDSLVHGGEDWEGAVVAAYHKLSRAEALPKTNQHRGMKIEQRNGEFHASLVSACSSPLLLALREQVFAFHERYRNLSRNLSSNARNTAAEHKAIFAAAIDHDTKELIALSQAHISRTTDCVTTYLANFRKEKNSR